MVPNVMVAGPNLKVNSVSDFIALARSNPGKLNVGSNGVGTTLHLSTYKTWDDVGRYYWGLVRDQLTPTKGEWRGPAQW